jgi:beta-glucosidase
MRLITSPTDFLGVNYYSRSVVRASSNGGAPVAHPDPHSEYTDMGWEVYPEGLYRLLVRLRGEYGPKSIYITENGAAFADVRSHDGDVNDLERIAYLDSHLDAIGRAIDAGVPVHGYFVWSLLDNFEWALGYSKRFGIVYVDYPTLERVPKSSYYWYRDLIAAANARTHPVSAGS